MGTISINIIIKPSKRTGGGGGFAARQPRGSFSFVMGLMMGFDDDDGVGPSVGLEAELSPAAALCGGTLSPDWCRGGPPTSENIHPI